MDNVHAKKDRMTRWIIGTTVGLSVIYLAVLLTSRTVPNITEAPWFIPVVGIFIAMNGVSVATLALGRFKVQRDPLSFWVGIAYSSIAIGQLFYVLAWPGLSMDGTAILANMPNTSAVLSALTFTLQSAFLLAAVTSQSPIKSLRPGGLGAALIWIVFVTVILTLPYSIEEYLPHFVQPDGRFTLLFYGWAGIQLFLFAIGGLVSIFHYRRTYDSLAGYIAFTQIFSTFIILSALLTVRRYDFWWFSQRLIALFGNLIVLYGLLSDYVSLFRQVRESEGRYQQLTESLPQLIWTCASDGRCDYLSPQWVAYTGIPAADQLGYKWLERLHPDDRQTSREVWQAAVNDNHLYEYEFRVRRADGVYRWFSSRALPIRDPDGRIEHWLGASTEIEERKRYLELLERNNRDLQEISFFTSHSLQEPLRKIEMYTDKLLEDSVGLERRPRERLARLQRSAGRMRAMLADLFHLSNLTTSPLCLEQVNLQEVVREALATLEPRLRGAQAQVAVGDLPECQADRAQMLELFLQLVGNALKFQPPGARPRIEIDTKPAPDGQVYIGVRDNGIGFDEAWAGRIFEPFQRLVGQNEFDGSGVGLAVCRKIVERHHGTITVSSRPSQGASFVIHLPLRQEAEREAREEHESA